MRPAREDVRKRLPGLRASRTEVAQLVQRHLDKDGNISLEWDPRNDRDRLLLGLGYLVGRGVLDCLGSGDAATLRLRVRNRPELKRMAERAPER